MRGPFPVRFPGSSAWRRQLPMATITEEENGRLMKNIADLRTLGISAGLEEPKHRGQTHVFCTVCRCLRESLAGSRQLGGTKLSLAVVIGPLNSTLMTLMSMLSK